METGLARNDTTRYREQLKRDTNMGHLQPIAVNATANESIDTGDRNPTSQTVADFTCICSVDMTRRNTIADPTRQIASSLCPAVSGMPTCSLL